MDIRKIIISYALILLALAGMFDTAYLAAQHISGDTVVCGIVEGCDSVLNSKYSEVFGIPLALIGLLYYATILVLAFIYIAREPKIATNLLMGITGLGFIASAYFIYLQLAVIHAICTYCMASAFVTLMLFGLSVNIHSKRKPAQIEH